MGRKLKHSEALLQFAVCFLFNSLMFFFKKLKIWLSIFKFGGLGSSLVFRVYKISP